MKAILKNGKWILCRAKKYTTLCTEKGLVFQKFTNESIDRIIGDFESQVKWFEDNLK